MSGAEAPSGSGAAASPVPPVGVRSDAAGHTTTDSGDQLILAPPAKTETTVSVDNGITQTVTLQGPPAGKRLTAWIWRVMSTFSPSIGKKNVTCLGKVTRGGAAQS